jgi:hypothetical protein
VSSLSLDPPIGFWVTALVVFVVRRCRRRGFESSGVLEDALKQASWWFGLSALAGVGRRA